jgi:putative peptidoglycan lipid II flippase
VKKILTSGGALLMGSAFISKILGLLRDRLLVATLPAEQLDRVFAAFRVPDFFFFLLVGGTVATLLLPRMAGLKKIDRVKFLSSFLWLIVTVFGLFCLIGATFPHYFVQIFASGFDSVAQSEISTLVRWLFGSVWLLACSAVFGAAQQEQQKFLSVALAPILYTGAICLGIWFGLEKHGLQVIGVSAVCGALLHLLMNFTAYFVSGGRLGWWWKKPVESWKNFGADCSARIGTNAAFQINLSADMWIASFLTAGAVSSYQIGTNLGMALLSMVGIPIASATFPKLTAARNNPIEQQKVLRDSLKWVFLATIPAALIGAIFAEFWLVFLFDAEGELLRLGKWIFQIVVLSLPAACAIPVLSRIFLANDDVKTPLRVTIIALSIATAVAALLALVILPKEISVLGLGVGTFLANILSALLFWRATKKHFQ